MDCAGRLDLRGSSSRESSEAIHLILGPVDPLATAVLRALRAKGHRVATLDHPYVSPHRCSWFLDDLRSIQDLWIEGIVKSDSAPIAGVLVRGQPLLDPAGWEERDRAYAQAELHAAVLAWLHGLDCPVINRFPGWSWFRRGPRLSDWYSSLRAAGLPFQDSMLTNDPTTTRLLGEAVVLNPMTSEAAFLIATGEDWKALASFQARAPAHLTRPHGAPWFACVVGDRVIWSGIPADGGSLEPCLVRFASLTGHALIEVAFAAVDDGMRVIAVDAFPTLDHQPPANHSTIAAAIVTLMTEGRPTPGGALQ